jgi:hypothetical protein
MVRNAGVADSSAFTLLGVSTSRYHSGRGLIGQFGSGSKHAIALFLRYGINPVIATGNLLMEFFTKPKFISGQQFDQVCVRYSGKDIDGNSKTATEDLGWTLQWGTQDWTKLPMAFREVVSNAIDGSILLMGKSYKDVEFKIKDKPRAKAGHTAVYLPFTQEVQSMWKQIGTLFLHYSNPSYLNRKILPKISQESHVLIYKKGVLACTLEGISAFDYNLGDELTLDESRNAQSWDVRYAVAKALAKAEPRDIAQILNAQLDGKQVWESKLESSYLYAEDEVSKKNFQTAFKAVAGENGVAVSGTKTVSDFVQRKGFKPVKIEPNWFQTLEKYGVATESQVLEGLEKDGMEELEPTVDMLDAVDKVWNLFESHDMLNGRSKPPVKAFSPLMSHEAQTWGMYKGNTVYLHTELGAGMLFKVALEEVAHHVTGATDMSRDMQDFLFRLVCKMM